MSLMIAVAVPLVYFTTRSSAKTKPAHWKAPMTTVALAPRGTYLDKSQSFLHIQGGGQHLGGHNGPDAHFLWGLPTIPVLLIGAGLFALSTAFGIAWLRAWKKRRPR